MSKFQNYLKTFDITSTLTEEDIDIESCSMYVRSLSEAGSYIS